MANNGNNYRWLPLIKAAQIDLNCSSEEELRQKLLDPANKEKLLKIIQSRQNSAPGKLPIAHVDGFDGAAKNVISKISPHLTVAQQFASANRELRFGDLPCLLVRMNDSTLAQHVPIEFVMTRVDQAQRRLEALPWMINPPPIAAAPVPMGDRAEHIIQSIHETRNAVEGMRNSINRLADAAEIEASFVSKNRQHLLNQIKRMEEEAKSKESALRELKEENKHLKAAIEKDTDDGYPLLSEDLVDSTVKNAINRTPSTSEFGDLLQIAESEAGTSGDDNKAAGRGKRKAAKAETAPSPKKGINPGTVA